MSVTTAQVVTLLENVLFESSDVAQANAANWVSQSATSDSLSTVAGLAAAMAATPEAGIAEQVVRYYMGSLGRVPRGDEIQFYVTAVEQGLTADQISQGASAITDAEWATIASYFSASPEFAADFGLTSAGQVNSSNEVLVIQAFYRNILGRTANSSEVQFYENALANGTTVANLVQYFTTSPEYQSSIDGAIQTALATYGASVANGGPVTQIPLSTSLTLGSSALTYNGALNVTSLSVTGTAAAAAQTAVTAVAGVIGVTAVTAGTGVQGVDGVTAVAAVAGRSAVTAVTDGAVIINDATSGASGSGTLTTISLANSGAGSAINDNGLTSLTLIGTTGTLALTNLNTAAIAAHASTLALTLDGLSAAANTITDTNNEIATLNITTATADSVLAGFTDTHLTSLSVTGTNVLTLKAINASLTSLTLSGAAGFSDAATSHSGGLAALGAHLTITDGSSGTFTAALDDTSQSFTGGSGVSVITVSALADATMTINAGSGTAGNEIIFEGGVYGLTSASSGKFLNFQTVGVAANVSGTIDLSVIDPTAGGLEVMGAGTLTFVKAATGAGLLLDASSGANVSVVYADSTGAADSVKVAMSSAVSALSLTDSAGVGIGTVSIDNELAASETNVSPAHTIGVFTDDGLSTLNVSGGAGLSITSLSETLNPAASFTLNNGSTSGYGVAIGSLADTALATLAFTGAGTSSIGSLTTGAATLSVTNAGTTLDYIGTVTDNSLTSLSLAANVSLGQASTALTSNGLQDGSTAGVTVSGGADDAHVTVNLTSGAASGKTDSITLGNGNNVVVDASTAGTVAISLGSGANLVELGGASLDTTAQYSVTFAARTAAAPNAVFVGAAGASYATAPNLVITGATTGDIIAFGNDSLSSSATLSATSLTGATSVASALSILEGAITAGTGHQVVYGVYAGNTYIIESSTGFVGATDTAVIEVTGAQTLTASTGYVSLGDAQTTLSIGSGLTGSGFTIPAGTPTTLTLASGANVVTLVGPTAGVADIFTSISGTTSLAINYQAGTSTGTDSIAMSGSLGANRSDVASLVVNDTSSGNAGVTIGAFTDNALTSATYANSAASNGSVVTQQAVTSSGLASINFTGGTSGKNTNTYYFTGILSTSSPLSIVDSNIGTGTATMGLTLAGGPAAVSVAMTSPGALAVGTLSDNNLATLAIGGSGTGTVSIGTLTDTMTGDFSVTDTSTSTGASTIALAGLSAAKTLTFTDSAVAALTDSSAYTDSALTALNLKNTGSGVLTVGNGGISANSLAKVSIDGSGIGSIVTGTLSDIGSGALAIVDTSTATGGTTLPLAGVSGPATITVTDSAAGALNLQALNDANLGTLTLTNSGSSTLTLGAVQAGAVSVGASPSVATFTLSLAGSGAIGLGAITDDVLASLVLSDTQTYTATTTSVTFASLRAAASVEIDDSAKGALSVALPTANFTAASLTFNNTGAAALTASATDSAAAVTMTLAGSGSGSETISLTDAASNASATSLTIVDTSTATGGITVLPTLAGGPVSLIVTDSSTAALTLGSSSALVTDENLTTVSLTNSGTALLTANGILSNADGVLTSLTLAGKGAILTGILANFDTAAAVSVTDSDSGAVTVGLQIGSAAGAANSLTALNSSSGALTLGSSANTVYLTGLTLQNTGLGNTNATIVDGASGVLTVSMTGSGTQTLTLTHNGVDGDIFGLGAGTDTLTIANSTLNDKVHVTFGTGTGNVTMTGGRTLGSLFSLNAPSSSNTNTTPVTADTITHLVLDSATTQGDTLAFGTTAILNTAAISAPGWTVSASGIMSNSNPTVLNFIAAVQGATAAGVAGFVDTSGSTPVNWVAYTDGAGHVGVIELASAQTVGTTTTATLLGFETGSSASLGYLHLV